MEEIKKTVMGTKVDYDAALAIIEPLIDALPNSLDEAKLEVFALAVDEYEKMFYPVEPPDPDEAIKLREGQENE